LYVVQLKVYVYEQLVAYAAAKAAVALAESPAGPVLLVLAEYGEVIAVAIGEYVDWTLEAIEALGREVIPLVDQLTALPIRLLRNRPIHQGRDRVMTVEDQAPIGERLARAPNLSEFPADGRTRRRGRDFPDSAEPSAVIKDVAPDGTLKRYAVYDSEGNITKRIDVQGRPHKGIYGESVPTPHVVYYRRDSTPDRARVNVRPDKQVRPAHPEELP
ncbi:MAG: polymorphic toxin type 24 domain-containing protein, partial [Propionibacteriales bacterium]|nr:polymorphic toxin type 24 domain-containing protein [Propionibacteriales bacterium]